MLNLTLFSQIISKLDRSKFNKLVNKKQTDKHNKGYNSWTHLVSMLFCQFAKSQSVRDISNGLRSATGNLNHLGIERAPSKSIFNYQNKHRDNSVFKDYYFTLLKSLGQQANFKAQLAGQEFDNTLSAGSMMGSVLKSKIGGIFKGKDKSED